MRTVIAVAFVSTLYAGDLEKFTGASLNNTQRNEACYNLRGTKSPELVDAMRAALTNVSLQACAGRNLRLAGAIDALAEALISPDASARAVAARELGSTGDTQFIPALQKAAADRDLLVASNAIEGLARYEDHSSAPALRQIAMSGGVLTSLALNVLLEWKDPETLHIARRLIAGKDPGDQLTALRVIGEQGDRSDLTRLQELAKDDTALNAGARGFGLMPAISVARAARVAMAGIQKRT